MKCTAAASAVCAAASAAAETARRAAAWCRAGSPGDDSGTDAEGRRATAGRVKKDEPQRHRDHRHAISSRGLREAGGRESFCKAAEQDFQSAGSAPAARRAPGAMPGGRRGHLEHTSALKRSLITSAAQQISRASGRLKTCAGGQASTNLTSTWATSSSKTATYVFEFAGRRVGRIGRSFAQGRPPSTGASSPSTFRSKSTTWQRMPGASRAGRQQAASRRSRDPRRAPPAAATVRRWSLPRAMPCAARPSGMLSVEWAGARCTRHAVAIDLV